MLKIVEIKVAQEDGSAETHDTINAILKLNKDTKNVIISCFQKNKAMLDALQSSLKECVNMPAINMPLALATFADYQLRMHGR